jgi:hypothetical protein
MNMLWLGCCLIDWSIGDEEKGWIIVFNVIKKISSALMFRTNKLECLTLAIIFNLVQYFPVKPERRSLEMLHSKRLRALFSNWKALMSLFWVMLCWMSLCGVFIQRCYALSSNFWCTMCQPPDPPSLQVSLLAGANVIKKFVRNWRIFVIS